MKRQPKPRKADKPRKVRKNLRPNPIAAEWRGPASVAPGGVTPREFGAFAKSFAGDLMVRTALAGATFEEKVLVSAMLPGVLGMIRGAAGTDAVKRAAEKILAELPDAKPE